MIDHKRGGGADGVVGTYRLLRRSAALRGGGFYSATEYDIAPMIAYPGEILELGRSCIDAAYRNRPTMQLLWRGIATYMFQYDITLMFGCASLPGTDPKALAVAALLPLSPPSGAAAVPRARAARPLCRDEHAAAWRGRRRAAVAQIDQRSVIAALPPLIKGYLRLGGLVGEGAVIDISSIRPMCCIIVVTDRVTEKYFRHYQRQAGVEE